MLFTGPVAPVLTWVFRQKSRMPQALVTFLLTTAIATHLCLGQLTTTTTTTTTITTTTTTTTATTATEAPVPKVKVLELTHQPITH